MKGSFTGATTNHKGLFEVAHRGTILLDEIAEMSPTMQVKFLRVLQEKKIRRIGSTEELEVDVRILAATNKDLERGVQDRSFREDLYYRLNVIPIHMPPLRERREDIPVLAAHFLAKASASTKKNVTKISEEAMERLQAYDWPGNVRELENVIERGGGARDLGRNPSGAAPGEGPRIRNCRRWPSRRRSRTTSFPTRASISAKGSRASREPFSPARWRRRVECRPKPPGS